MVYMFKAPSQYTCQPAVTSGCYCVARHLGGAPCFEHKPPLHFYRETFINDSPDFVHSSTLLVFFGGGFPCFVSPHDAHLRSFLRKRTPRNRHSQSTLYTHVSHTEEGGGNNRILYMRVHGQDGGLLSLRRDYHDVVRRRHRRNGQTTWIE
ncbi:hypothetical protein BD289DRAFT_289127 [Coniella lustricola]|uniref:Uncharacterized protein n=1 Tax=Coniella lustricola TaxID=2025994 RepID=A0A2T3A5L1_9PEZI|nr:hypothetical protein BD289DRAFT_289127 [Coniella lustricola]